MEDIESVFRNIPEAILPPLSMTKPNEKILVYQGEFVLKGETEFKLIGEIYFKWFPTLGCCFKAVGKSSRPIDLIKLFQGFKKFKLLINTLEFGDCFLTEISGNGFLLNEEQDKSFDVSGVVEFDSIKGDKTVPVNKVRFTIPNLSEISGESVKYLIDKKEQFRKARLTLEDADYLITLNQISNYDNLVKNSLKQEGGFMILYSGELIKKNGDILHINTEDVFDCLSNFLSFLNGSRVSIIFKQGLFDDQEVWMDYTPHPVDNYRLRFTWVSRHSHKDLNQLWCNFYSLWKNEDHREFLKLAVHWYLEANAHSGSYNGAIILAQTGLELIYNWLLIENKKLLVGKDAENISAANKIRLLLSHLNIDYNSPDAFTELTNYINISDNIPDAPEAIVNIRNTIVHSQLDKRKKLSNMSYEVRRQALELGLWYIELALLSLLKYKGVYKIRCSEYSREEDIVPWAKNS